MKRGRSLKIFLMLIILALTGCATLPQMEAMRKTDKTIRRTYNADINLVFEAVKFGYNHKLHYIGAAGEFDNYNYRVLGRHPDAPSQFMWGIFLKKLENGDTQVDFVNVNIADPHSKLLAESIQGGLEAYLAGEQEAWVKKWTKAQNRHLIPEESFE